METINKTCFKCLKSKSLSDFYKHKGNSDGHLGKCKECAKSDTKKRFEILKKDDKWIDKERCRSREKYHRLGYRGIYKPNYETKSKIMSDYFTLYPEKYKAHISAQRLKVEKGLERHHWSYNEIHGKDIIPLTKKDHMKAHRFLLYDKDYFMYRRSDNNELLDTKEKHLEYIKQVIYNERN